MPTHTHTYLRNANLTSDNITVDENYETYIQV